VARQRQVRWDVLADELGYSDQSHLVRDFTSVIGMPPARYADACRASTAEAGTSPHGSSAPNRPV
jgi:AraC-like DNA-binding protein